MTNTPTPAVVARAATTRMTASATGLTLLGIFGPDSDLRALVRLPGGRVREVSHGTRLSHGRVVGIDAEGLMLEQAGRTRRIPVAGG